MDSLLHLAGVRTDLLNRNKRPNENMEKLKQLVETQEAALLQPKSDQQIEDDINTKYSTALIDNLTGSNLSSSLERKLPPMKRLAQALNNRRMMPSEQSNDALSVKDVISLQRKEQEDKARDMRNVEGMKSRFATNYAKDLTKLTDTVGKDIQKLGNLKSRLASGTVADKGALVSGIARFLNAETGPLSEGDVGRSMARNLQDIMAEVETFWDSNPNKPLSPDLLSALRKQVADAEQHMVESFEAKANSRKNAAKALINSGVRGASDFGSNNLDRIHSEILKPYSAYSSSSNKNEKSERIEIPQDALAGPRKRSEAMKPRAVSTRDLEGVNKQAYEWAMKNSSDPRSKAILTKLGVN